MVPSKSLLPRSIIEVLAFPYQAILYNREKDLLNEKDRSSVKFPISEGMVPTKLL